MNPVKEIAGILLGKQGQGTLKAHMVRGTVGTFVLKVVNTVLAFGTSLLLARLLGAKEYGVYAYAISWASLLSVPAVMGLNTLLVREVAKYKALEDWGSLRGIIRWSDRVVLVTSLGLAGLFALIVWALQSKFDSEVKMALWLAMALVPLLAFLLLRQGGLQGLGYITESQLPLQLAFPVFFVASVGIYTMLHFSLKSSSAIVIRLFAGLLAMMLSMVLLIIRLPSRVKVSFNIIKYSPRNWSKSMVALVFIGTMGILNQRISTIIVGSFLGAEAAGIFDIVFKVATLVSFPLVATSIAMSPLIAKLYALNSKKHLQLVFTKSNQSSFLLSAAIGLGLFLYGRPVLSIFGARFTNGYSPLVILIVGFLINAFVGPADRLLLMTRHETSAAKCWVISVGINVVLQGILVPLWHINGAALSNLISMAVWNLLFIMEVSHKLGISTTILGGHTWRTMGQKLL